MVATMGLFLAGLGIHWIAKWIVTHYLSRLDRFALTVSVALIAGTLLGLAQASSLYQRYRFRPVVYRVLEQQAGEWLSVHSEPTAVILASERIGYLAVNPEAEDAGTIVAAATATNTMFYVNAPSLFQLAVAQVQDAAVDVSRYRARRDLLCDGLAAAGYQFTIPEGAFYLFPKSPLEDEMAFLRILTEELILVTPGRGFGRPGHFRISYAVPSVVISGAMDGFKRAMAKATSL